MKIIRNDGSCCLYNKQENYILITIIVQKNGNIHLYWRDEKPRIERKRDIGIKRLANLKLNGCALCGYNKCSRALDYHHIEKKSFSLSRKGIKGHTNKEIADEIAKCILLCANCHRELHYND